MAEVSEELVIEEPTEELIRNIMRVVQERDGNLHSVHLRADESTLRDIIAECVDERITLADSRDRPSVPTSESLAVPSPGTKGGTAALRTDGGDSVRSTGDGVTASPPASGDDRLPVPRREDYETTDDWLSAVGSHLGIDHHALRDIVLAHAGHVNGLRKRHLLALAFESHLEREPCADCAHVDIRIREPLSLGRYQYLNNRSGCGGAHYLRELAPRTKANVSWLASCNGLTVLSEGTSSLSVSFGQPAVEADVRFVERVLSDVFGGSIDDVVSIVEVIDRDTTRAWLS